MPTRCLCEARASQESQVGRPAPELQEADFNRFTGPRRPGNTDSGAQRQRTGWGDNPQRGVTPHPPVLGHLVGTAGRNGQGERDGPASSGFAAQRVGNLKANQPGHEVGTQRARYRLEVDLSLGEHAAQKPESDIVDRNPADDEGGKTERQPQPQTSASSPSSSR